MGGITCTIVVNDQKNKLSRTCKLSLSKPISSKVGKNVYQLHSHNQEKSQHENKQF